MEAAKQSSSGGLKRPSPLRKGSEGLPAGTLTITVRQLAAELGISRAP
jgi:hypothetical protein